MKKRVLLLTTYFNKDNSVGAIRIVNLHEHLIKKGYEVFVITTDQTSIENEKILIAKDLCSQAEGMMSIVLRIARRGLYSLGGVKWNTLYRKVISLSFNLINKEKIDLVIATTPNHEMIEVALLLKQSTGVKVIADIRDGITYEPIYDAKGLQRKRLNRLEKNIALYADKIVTVSPPISDFYIHTMTVKSSNVLTITNGIESNNISMSNRIVKNKLGNKVNITYCGKLDKSEKGRFDVCKALIHAFSLLNDNDKKRINISFYGDFYDYEIAEMSKFFTVHGSINRDKVLEIQRHSDILLLLACEKYSVVTGKLFEYLATGNPILGIFDKPYAGKIIDELGAGKVVSPFDPEKIAQCLIEFTKSNTDNYIGNIAPYKFEVLLPQYERLIYEL
jgi:glycosyltransferase involved in cell wall biosynthesis